MLFTEIVNVTLNEVSNLSKLAQNLEDIKIRNYFSNEKKCLCLIRNYLLIFKSILEQSLPK